MKTQKFLVTDPSGELFGLKRDSSSHTTTLGGNGQFIELMGQIIKSGFKRNLPRASWISANKVRFKFESKTEDWIRVRDQLEKAGFILTESKSIGRIMR